MTEAAPKERERLSDEDIREGFRLAGLATDQQLEAFRALRRLSELTALSKDVIAFHPHTATSTKSGEDSDG